VIQVFEQLQRIIDHGVRALTSQIHEHAHTAVRALTQGAI
jgi:hypothetical protein